MPLSLISYPMYQILPCLIRWIHCLLYISMAPPNSGTAQHPIQDSSTKVLDRYLLTDCSYLLTDCFPHFQPLSTLQQAFSHLKSCTHGTISLPNSSLSWPGSPFLIHPWDLKCPPLQTILLFCHCFLFFPSEHLPYVGLFICLPI